MLRRIRRSSCVLVPVEEVDVVVSHTYLSGVDGFAEWYGCHVLLFGSAAAVGTIATWAKKGIGELASYIATRPVATAIGRGFAWISTSPCRVARSRRLLARCTMLFLCISKAFPACPRTTGASSAPPRAARSLQCECPKKDSQFVRLGTHCVMLRTVLDRGKHNFCAKAIYFLQCRSHFCNALVVGI